MTALHELAKLCNGSIFIEINPHLSENDTVEEHLTLYGDGDLESFDSVIYNTMIATNTLIHVQAYPKNSVGYISSIHYDLEIALRDVLLAVKLDLQNTSTK